MAQGYFALVLHAHLPFVRHPEHERSLEERWLFEALIECYLPLIDIFDRLAEEEVPFAVTMSVTPPLQAMLSDRFLQRRFTEHLERLERLAEHEKRRLANAPASERAAFGPLAAFYAGEFLRIRRIWQRISGDVLAALVRHHDSGSVELMTSSATHAFLPGLLPTPRAIDAQLDLGMRSFESLVGREAHGAWLPECAYHPHLDEKLARAGIRFSVLDRHGIEHAEPRPPHGVLRPVVSPSGVAFFGRDSASSEQVWSRDQGYPGDPNYRDFYRDIGFDLPEEHLHGETVGDGHRLMTGIKYHRITGATQDKAPYHPGIARDRAWLHAADFVRKRKAQIEQATGSVPSPIIVSPYDAELFGHWWFEGPHFIEGIFRHFVTVRETVEPITLRRYLEDHALVVRATPAASTWGEHGHGEVWTGHRSAWMWRHVHHATRHVEWILREHGEATGARGRALDQMIRELLLLQSSDWAFIVHTGTSTRYAESRFRAHVHCLQHLGHLVEKPDWNDFDHLFVDDLETRDNFLEGFGGRALRSCFS